MNTPNHEYTTVDFTCPAVGRAVQISREYEVQVTRSGKFLGRVVASTDCTDKAHCPVACNDGPGVAFDWTRCVYLHPTPP